MTVYGTFTDYKLVFKVLKRCLAGFRLNALNKSERYHLENTHPSLNLKLRF